MERKNGPKQCVRFPSVAILSVTMEFVKLFYSSLPAITKRTTPTPSNGIKGVVERFEQKEDLRGVSYTGPCGEPANIGKEHGTRMGEREREKTEKVVRNKLL
jgi:hypothetical protein